MNGDEIVPNSTILIDRNRITYVGTGDNIRYGDDFKRVDVTGKFIAIKELGYGIAIDDFGTGYSSLSYLKNLPVDTLKIDQAFIRDLHRSAQDVTIVTAVVRMGQSLGFAIVAEGVEEARHVQILQGLGCDQGQGYHFSRPVPEAELIPLLKQGCGTVKA